MRKPVISRPLMVLVAFVSVVGTSVALGIGAAPAGAATLAFINSPTAAETAGLVFSSATPEVQVTGASGVSTVTFSITPGTGTAGAVLTCGGSGTNGDTFSVSGGLASATGCSINRDGTGYKLSASEAPDGGTAPPSPAFNVTGGASKLEFSAFPTSTVAGQLFAGSLSVQIENADGTNVDPSSTLATDTIALQIASGTPGATLTCLPKAAVAGVASFFSCSINLVGNYTLEAVDTTNPFISPAFSSPLFTAVPITPSTATKIVYLTQPATNSTVASGPPASFPIVVAEEDAFGNVVTTDSTSMVAMSIQIDPTGGQATLVCPGVANTLQLINGIANFSPGCIIEPTVPVVDNPTGTGYQLLATDGAFTALTNLFNVNTVTIPAAVTTLPAGPITATGAVLNGSLNPGGFAQTCDYIYGTDPALIVGTTTTGILTTAAVTTPVSVPILVGPLAPGTTYYFELICSDGTGAILNFTTLVAGSVVTNAATPVGINAATLNGTVNPGGASVTCSYLYSTQSNLAGAVSSSSVVIPATFNSVSVPIPISGLGSGVTYYYELVCSNGTGAILSFHTAPGVNPPLLDLAGPDAIGTGIVTSQAAYPGTGSAHVVVLARSDYFADALAGDPLAAALGGPLLITPGASISSVIDPRVLSEIMRVLPPGGTVYILGGFDALSVNIDNALNFFGYHVVRVAGLNQYGTAVDVAGLLGDPATIFEVSALSPYDAMSAGPAAIKTGGAILETDGNVQAPETATYLAAHPGDTRYTIGGSLAAGGADPTANNVSGFDSYGTSAAVAQAFFPGAHTFAIASLLSYTDALAAGYFIVTGGLSGPLLLVPPLPPLPGSIAAYLASLAPGTQGYAFGGVLAISTAILTLVQGAIG